MLFSLLTDGIYPHQVGGMQKHSYYLAEFLARQGGEVHLYHLGCAKPRPFSSETRPCIVERAVPFPAQGRFRGTTCATRIATQKP